MNKRIIALLLMLITILPLVSCGTDKVSDYNKKRFVTLDDEYAIGSGSTLEIYYDSVTSIVYKRIKGGSSDGSPLIGQNKLPMTLNEYLDSKK